MNRRTKRVAQACAATLVALCAPLAIADDSSMSVLTGDSYAFFSNLDYHPGRFSSARAPLITDDAVAKMPRKTLDVARTPIRLAGRPHGEPTNPFRDDQGA